jgi:hypothetical protein
MGNLEVDPQRVYAAYDQKLSAAHKENAVLSGAVGQLQEMLAEVQGELDLLKVENEQLRQNQQVDEPMLPGK